MPMMVLDRDTTEEVLERRRALGNRTREEVWDGVTYIMPEADNEHQDLAYLFGLYFGIAVLLNGPGGRINSTSNLSDQIAKWKKNYRNPDLAYFAPSTQAEDHGTFWYGGPDFLLEIVSPDDMSRDKLPFYASIGTREVLIVDRDPWQLELYQLRRGKLHLVGTAKPGDGKALASNVVPLTFALVRGKPRPKIRITHSETEQKWTF
jgi:Uma2 family endonuclease